MQKQTDIQYATAELLERLDQLAIDDLLRLKMMSYMIKSFQSEEVLDKNCRALDMYYDNTNHEYKSMQKTLKGGE